jgi:predicted nucleic acid-binding protein
MDFLDTNVILRYLTRDDPVKAERCFELFQRLKRKEVKLVTSESVLAEVVYVKAGSKCGICCCRSSPCPDSRYPTDLHFYAPLRSTPSRIWILKIAFPWPIWSG